MYQQATYLCMVGEVARGLSQPLRSRASSEVRRCNCSVVTITTSIEYRLEKTHASFYQRSIYLSIYRRNQKSLYQCVDGQASY